MALLNVLAKAGSETVILFLYNKGESHFGEIAKLMNHRSTATRVLRNLSEANLVNRRVLEDRTVQYRLTEKGEKVAKVLKELKEIEDNV